MRKRKPWLLLVAGVFAPACASGPGPAAAPAPGPVASAEVAAPLPAAPDAEPPVAASPPPPAPAAVPAPPRMKEEYRQLADLEEALRAARDAGSQTAARSARDAFLREAVARWEGAEIPAEEACYAALLLRQARRYPEASREATRFLESAPETHRYYARVHACRILSLAEAGDFEGAGAVFDGVASSVFASRPEERRGVEESLGNLLVAGGRLAEGAARLGRIAGETGNPHVAVQAVDALLRLERNAEARDLARRVAAIAAEGPDAVRAAVLVRQTDLVGKPAPGFAAAKWWKGTGAPLADADLRGGVTVAFVWNMKAAWNVHFFERLGRMIREFEGRPVRFVGLSRLARFDAFAGGARPGMTVEEELRQYDAWTEQYAVACPLAVDAFGSDALLGPWAGAVVPAWVVAGKDGNVCYVRTGKDEAHFAILREMVERALAR
jgi:hypothetical protein